MTKPNTSKTNTSKPARIVNLNDRLWFGKYKGLRISEVPEDYVGWCIEKGIFSVGEKDYWFKESCRLQRAEDEAMFESCHGDWGDRD